MSERKTPTISQSTLIQLYTRFILNLPTELKEECNRNFVRLFFEVERAHWFYLDHYIEDPSIGGVDMYGFTERLFEQFPSIVPGGVDWREKFLEWRKYRGETETGSAIILDQYFEMLLLVQGFYGNRWNFPGGKLNENETFIDCAAREVLEETGLDVEYRIIPSLYIDRNIGGTLRRAFIVEDMPRISRLQPCTCNEIEAITWFNLQDLPTHAQDTNPMKKFNMRPNNFYMILPFMKQLKEYVRLRRSGVHALTALDESSKLVESDHSSAIPPEPKMVVESAPAKTPRSRPKKRKKAHSASQPSGGANKQSSNPQKQTLNSNLHPLGKMDLDECRKHLILLRVPPPVSQPSSIVDFSPSFWSDVRVRGDVLMDLLTAP
ncbi:unnamed protein product [Dicrocoelium dendriticum]|nr:unnamed protein product [Dicrocoelium dendriticum]